MKNSKDNVKTESSNDALSNAEMNDIINGRMIIPGMGKRMLAYLIDLSVVFGLGLGTHMFLLLLTSGTSFAAAIGNLFSLGLFLLACNSAYHILMEGHTKTRATLGKIIMGLQVTDLNVQHIGYKTAALRFFWRIPSILTVGLFYFTSARNNCSLALHDKMTNTLTVERGMPVSAIKSGIRAGRAKTKLDNACILLTGLFFLYLVFVLIFRVIAF